MALPVQSDFLDKVYDVYETRDFRYGSAELNPLRELSTKEILSKEDIESRMMARIQERMQRIVDETIQQQLARRRKSGNSIGELGLGAGETGAGFGDGTDTDGLGGSGTGGSGGAGGSGSGANSRAANAVGAGETLADPKKNPKLKQKIMMLGGDPDAGQLINLINSQHNPADDETPYDLKVIEMIVSSPTVSGMAGSALSKTMSGLLDDGPFKMDCDGVVMPDDGDEDDKADDDALAQALKDAGLNAVDEANQDEEAESQQAEDDENDDDATNDALTKLLDDVHEKLLKQDFQLFQCAAVELGFLKIVLAMLKVIKILKVIIDMVLALLLPIIAIVQLAIGAWLNPSNIAKIVQLIVMKIISIVVMLITMILQMIWDLLNVDCIASSTQKVIDDIKKALAGMDTIVGEFNGNFVATTLGKVNDKILSPLAAISDQVRANVDEWKHADETFNEMMKGLSKEALQATLASAVTGAVSPFASRIQSKVDAVKDVANEVATFDQRAAATAEKAAANQEKQLDKTKALGNNILKGPAAGLDSPRVQKLRTS